MVIRIGDNKMKMDLSKFRQPCSCGKKHEILVKEILIEANAIVHIDRFLKEHKLDKQVILVCDTNTYEIASYVEKTLSALETYSIKLNAYGLHADEKGTEQLAKQIQTKPSVLIAVGSGTIHDLTRFVANEMCIPFISVPTAASVDGFVSTVSAMTYNGFKVTHPGSSPVGVFADTNIFSKAPFRLTVSGVGDLLGKYTALLDWKVANILTNEYICDRVIAIEEEAINEVVYSLEGLNKGDQKAYESLMYGLLLSGLAMQMVGNSRPASGAEHHLSHLWEMHVINQEIEALHGEKVGVALAIVCNKYKELCKLNTIGDKVKEYEELPVADLKKVFGELAPSILSENAHDVLEDVKSAVLVEKFEAIKALVEKLPSGEVIQKLLLSVKGKTVPEDIGLEADIIEKSIQFSPYVRARLSLMRVLKLIV